MVGVGVGVGIGGVGVGDGDGAQFGLLTVPEASTSPFDLRTSQLCGPGSTITRSIESSVIL